MMPSLSSLFEGKGSIVGPSLTNPFNLDLFSNQKSFGNATLPLDVYESGGAYHIEADVPGLKEEDIKLSLNKDSTVLTVETHKEFVDERDEKDASGNIVYHHVERRQGKSKRSVNLPVDSDASKINAVLKEGVLYIDVARDQRVDAGGNVINVPIKSEWTGLNA
jgi:HSP20 family protein